jgi:predicted DNA-binding protein YlxM (UPF0122 family)
MNDKIKKSLAEVSIEDLMAIIAEKKQATYQPMIDEYEATESKLNELRFKIQTIDPQWQPKTLADKIVEFVTEKGGKNVEEKSILERFNTVQGGYIKNTLKKITGEGGRLTVKEQKYTTVTK